jgi:hypothetical protein
MIPGVEAEYRPTGSIRLFGQGRKLRLIKTKMRTIFFFGLTIIVRALATAGGRFNAAAHPVKRTTWLRTGQG